VPSSPNKPLMQWNLWKWSRSPHKKLGKKPHNTTKKLVGNPNHLGPKDIQKFAWRSSQKRWVDVKRLIKKRMNRINKVSRQNIKKRSQQLLAHPLTSKMHLHYEHLHPTHLVKNLVTHERIFYDEFLEKILFWWKTCKNESFQFKICYFSINLRF
jgi:hypothetical protein